MAELLPISDVEWRAFVGNHPEAGPFHHPHWAQLLAEVYDREAAAIVWRTAEGTIDAGLPILIEGARRRRWVGLPFTDYCPPLANRAFLAEDVGAAAVAAHARPISVEVRADLPGSGHRQPVGYRHELLLGPDPEEIRRGFRKGCQTSIKRAEREGIDVRRSVAEADLIDGFYLLHQRTRKRLGVPVQPRRFFHHLHRLLLAEGLGFVLSAYKDDRIIASAVFLAWNGSVVYKYSASDYESRRLCGANAVLWDAISWSCRNGFESLDFGRTDSGNEGLRNFKQSWGTEEYSLAYTHIGDEPIRNPRTSLLLKGVRPLIRHGPLWVGRAIGWLGYRRAG